MLFHHRVDLVDVAGEDRELRVFDDPRGSVRGGHKRCSKVIERGSRVEHDLASEDRQHRVVRFGEVHAPDVLARLPHTLESFADWVCAARLERPDSLCAVAQVFLCAADLSPPRSRHRPRRGYTRARMGPTGGGPLPALIGWGRINRAAMSRWDCESNKAHRLTPSTDRCSHRAQGGGHRGDAQTSRGSEAPAKKTAWSHSGRTIARAAEVERQRRATIARLVVLTAGWGSSLGARLLDPLVRTNRQSCRRHAP